MLNIANDINTAIMLLKDKLCENFGATTQLVIFGSYARGEFKPDSDIDILVLLPINVDNNIRLNVYDIAYEIELQHDVIFNLIPYSKKFWSSSKAKTMPLYKCITAQGKKVE